MPNNNKENQESGSPHSMNNSSTENSSDRNSEDRSSGNTVGEKAGGYGKDTEVQGSADNDDMTTAGGREGHFSDQNRDSESQWSPGASGGSSDD